MLLFLFLKLLDLYLLLLLHLLLLHHLFLLQMWNSSLTTFEFIDLIAIHLRCIFTWLLMWSSTFIVKYIRCRVGHMCAVMGKNGVKKKCLLLQKKPSLSKKNYANVQIQFSMWVQRCTDDLLFKRHQTFSVSVFFCFCRIDRGRDNPDNPGVWWG